jgi:hypothetical protein
MPEQELVVLRQFTNRIDAEVARSVLKAARIMSYINGDDPGVRAPVFLPVRIELVVRASDAAEADSILGPEGTF